MAETSFKDILVTLPVLGTTLAVTFDVGYFYGIDINYFSLFSVSEHVAFALEALPFAMGLASFFVVGTMALDSARARRLRKQAGSEGTKHTPFYRRTLFWLLAAAMAWNVWDLWRDPSSAFSWITLAIGVLLLSMIVWFENDVSQSSLTGFAAAVSLFIAFSLGFDAARIYKKSEHYRYTVSLANTEIKAKVARSGEKGLLFFEAPTNRLRFLPWSDIKGISSEADAPAPAKPSAAASPLLESDKSH
jgi:hypothetical protein